MSELISNNPPNSQLELKVLETFGLIKPKIFNKNYDPMLISTIIPPPEIPYLDQLEKKADLQMYHCFNKLSDDIEILLTIAKESTFSNEIELETTANKLMGEDAERWKWGRGVEHAKTDNMNKDNGIEARLISWEPLSALMYNDLCDSYNIGSDNRKKIRARKISIHMPRLLAFLGFNAHHLKMVLTKDSGSNSLQENINKMTEWFNDILEEEEGKWCQIWPRCISTSAFAVILVKYLKNLNRITINTKFFNSNACDTIRTYVKDNNESQKGWLRCISYYKMKFCPYDIYCVKKHSLEPECYCNSYTCKRLHPEYSENGILNTFLHPWNVKSTEKYYRNNIRTAQKYIDDFDKI